MACFHLVPLHIVVNGKGVRYNNLTSHVLKLDLHGEITLEYNYHEYNDEIIQRSYINDTIYKSLMELLHLKYLNHRLGVHCNNLTSHVLMLDLHGEVTVEYNYRQ
ncbi:receptor-like protein 12 [Sesbania bispinosa]|nr:receptor-like protein 12 [Sesbania bispinosa]